MSAAESAGADGLDLVEAVRHTLAVHADPDRAAAQQRYMKSALPYFGVTRPVLQASLRPIFADPALMPADGDAWEATIRRLWDGAQHREEWYAALILARHRSARGWRDSSRLPLWRQLITTGAWWDVVDEIAAHLIGPVLRAESAVVRPVLWEWASAEDLWLRRTAILASLGAREQTDLGLLTHAITENLEPRLAGTPLAREFFIRKAIGWALRSYAATDSEWVRAFLETHRAELSGLSLREASKHLG